MTWNQGHSRPVNRAGFLAGKEHPVVDLDFALGNIIEFPLQQGPFERLQVVDK